MDVRALTPDYVAATIPSADSMKSGVFCFNPPYGVRIGGEAGEENLLDLYADMGRALSRFTGWRAACFVANRAFRVCLRPLPDDDQAGDQRGAARRVLHLPVLTRPGSDASGRVPLTEGGLHGTRTTQTTALAWESMPTTRRLPSLRTSLMALAAAHRFAGSCSMPVDSDQKKPVLVPVAEVLRPTTSPDALMSRAQLSFPPNVPRNCTSRRAHTRRPPEHSRPACKGPLPGRRGRRSRLLPGRCPDGCRSARSDALPPQGPSGPARLPRQMPATPVRR